MEKPANLHLQGSATDQIWAMVDGPDRIGLRLDGGDAGVVYLTREQAEMVIETLKECIWPGWVE